MFMPTPMPSLSLVAPASSSENDPVPVDIRAVIDLFTTHLAKVSFPDVDAASLRKYADELRAAAKNVAAARDALATALAATEDRLATLSDAASRAVRYARIYGEAHPDRHAIVEALGNLTPAATPAQASTGGKRRGRPPKKRDSAELFDAAPAEAQA
jgi:ABC-type transporter Mla subunit MlaD